MIRLLALLGGVVTLLFSPANANDRTVLSKDTLLSPHLKVGSLLRWSNLLVENGRHLPALVFGCKIQNQTSAGYRVLPSAAVGDTPLQPFQGLEFTLQAGDALGE